MIIYAGKDYQDVSRKAANIMSAQIIMKPDTVLGLATGSTPVGMYAQLVEWYKKGDLDFSRVTSVNLDEYKGLSGDNDQSYRYFMDHNLFDHVNIDKARTLCLMDWKRIAIRHVHSITKSSGKPEVWICSCLVSAGTDTSASMNQEMPLKKKPIVWI